jgi:hypothetical protein
MCLRRSEMNCPVIGLTVLIFFCISSGLPGSVAFADEVSHYRVALQLVSIAYNEQATYDDARRGALLAVKDRFEKNPKTSEYAPILINLVMEVLDAYFHDPQTQTAIKKAFAKLYVGEFTEYELKEFIKFYKTPVGRKALQKLPVVTQKGWEIGSAIGGQVSSSPKYEQLLVEKIKRLQEKGQLPQEFK